MAATSDSWRSAIDEATSGLLKPIDCLRDALLAVSRFAAGDMDAAESSVLVATGDGGGLRFLVSHSPHASELAEVRVPIESTVAGRVYLTGQLIAVEDEPPAIPLPGKPPKVYLAYPLSVAEDTLGVATYVNRKGEPPFRRFDKQDLALAARYGAVQAILLQQYLRLRTLSDLGVESLAQAVAAETKDEHRISAASDGLQVVGDEPWRDAVQQFHKLGESEARLCASVVALVRQWADGELE